MNIPIINEEKINNLKLRLSTSMPIINTNNISKIIKCKEKKPFIIGVAGGTASGKTSVCNLIVEKLGLDKKRVGIISQDCFYKNLTKDDLERVHKNEYNFDHPGNIYIYIYIFIII